MREPQQQQTSHDDEATLVVGGEETTLVAPRFDDEETLVARPVVPFDADAPAVPTPERPAARPARRSPYAPRRSPRRTRGMNTRLKLSGDPAREEEDTPAATVL